MKRGIYSPFFLSSKWSLFHNSSVFVSYIIHILYTECAKIKKKKFRRQKVKKGSKWHWSSESQKPFVKLRDKFANSIHLVQPDAIVSYILNTDANGIAIWGVLMQIETV